MSACLQMLRLPTVKKRWTLQDWFEANQPQQRHSLGLYSQWQKMYGACHRSGVCGQAVQTQEAVGGV